MQSKRCSFSGAEVHAQSEKLEVLDGTNFKLVQVHNYARFSVIVVTQMEDITRNQNCF